MPTEKVADLPPQETCRDLDHRPEIGQVFDLGYYEHTCPACDLRTYFAITNPNNPTWPSGAVTVGWEKIQLERHRTRPLTTTDGGLSG